MAAAAMLDFSGCAKPTPCQNVVLDEAPSPGGRLRAVVFERRCPDSGRRTTEISILKRGEALPDGNGNIFAHDAAIGVKVGWQTNEKLVVYSFGDLTRGTRLERAGDIAIEYDQMVEADLVGPLGTPTPAGNPAAGSPAPTPP